mmetsp:Transcript_20705/g.79388  ORF Transcript_20705/g.79388 Transcript_20705/m.79388 type:complete len:259 (+) Transcript_20705:1555-2331(+)
MQLHARERAPRRGPIAAVLLRACGLRLGLGGEAAAAGRLADVVQLRRPALRHRRPPADTRRGGRGGGGRGGGRGRLLGREGGGCLVAPAGRLAQLLRTPRDPLRGGRLLLLRPLLLHPLLLLFLAPLSGPRRRGLLWHRCLLRTLLRLSRDLCACGRGGGLLVGEVGHAARRRQGGAPLRRRGGCSRLLAARGLLLGRAGELRADVLGVHGHGHLQLGDLRLCRASHAPLSLLRCSGRCLAVGGGGGARLPSVLPLRL